jgi:hypothetical protein
MLMPEAPVNEDDFPFAPKDDIWLARKVLAMEAVAKAKLP